MLLQMTVLHCYFCTRLGRRLAFFFGFEIVHGTKLIPGIAQPSDPETAFFAIDTRANMEHPMTHPLRSAGYITRNHTQCPTRCSGQRSSRRQVKMQGSFLTMASLLFILILSQPVQARTFHCRGGDVSCLIAAIKQANVQPGLRHEIRLGKGTYALMAVDNQTGGPNGLPSITRKLTIKGVGAGSTVIERDADALDFRLLHVAATGSLTLEGLTLRGGRVEFSGGGIFNLGTVTILRSTLIDNVAFGGFSSIGGGLSNMGGALTLINSNISGNIAVAGDNGNAAGIHSQDGTVSIINSSIVDNVALGADAGAGAGLLSQRDALTIINSTIADNTATGPGGGLALGASTVTLVNSTVARNSACGAGGSVRGGGGLLNAGGAVTIINSTIAGNSTCSGSPLFFGDGGGLLNLPGGSVRLLNTIIALNTAPLGGSDCSGVITSQGHNVIGDPTNCTVELQPFDLTGNPGLGAFTDNGLPGEGHFPLLATSRAIDAGDDNACPPMDQLGQLRVGTCDIGAVEFQGSLVAAVR